MIKSGQMGYFHEDIAIFAEEMQKAMNNQRILITGASGFIGSTITDQALELGYETWAGIRPGSSRRYLQDKRLRLIELRYDDPMKLTQQFRELVNQSGSFDAVIHVAGLTKAKRLDDFDRVNYLYTRQLADALQETGALTGTFVLLSSLSVMGPGDEKGYTPFSMESEPRPNTAYGRSKLKAEQFLVSQQSFPWLIIRPTGVYGPRDRDYLILMKAVKNGLDVGAGFRKQLLTFIHSQDLAAVIFTLLAKGIKNKCYFVADGDSYTDSEFNAIVKEALGKKSVIRLKLPLWLVKPAAFVSGRLSALMGRTTTFNSDKYHIMKQRNWTCDVTPLQQDIGFTPRWRLREGVKMTVEWYRKEGWL